MIQTDGFATSTETELKFSLDPADIDRFEALAVLAGAPRTQSSLVATYLDTDDRALQRAGFSLRLRRNGDRITQTLKGPSTGTGGMFARPETERLLDSDAVDETMLAAALPDDLYLVVSGRLAPLFTVTVERTEWRVEEEAGVIGVSLDRGAIEAAGEREALNEVELELHQGAIGALFHLAEAIVRHLPLHLETETKAARGYRLLGAALPSSEGPKPVLEPATPVGEAIPALIAPLVGAIAIERAAVVRVGDEAAVHRMRVLLRRLRSLIEIADETIAPRKSGKAARIVRRAFKRLGAVRDLDILAAAIPLNAEAAEAALLRIATARAAALAEARRLLVSRRFAAAMLRLLGLSAGVASLKAELSIPVADEAGRVLARRWRRLKRAAPPTESGADARHRLRIDAKTLRYTSDFFEGLFASERALKRRRKLDVALRRLQDQLGTLNDRRNTERLARAHLGARAAAALGLSGTKAPTPDGLAEADKAYAKLVGLKRYWR